MEQELCHILQQTEESYVAIHPGIKEKQEGWQVWYAKWLLTFFDLQAIFGFLPTHEQLQFALLQGEIAYGAARPKKPGLSLWAVGCINYYQKIRLKYDATRLYSNTVMKLLGGLSFLVITILLLLVVIWYYFFSRVIATTKDASITTSSDNNRLHAVNDLAAKISFLASQQQDSGVLFPQDWQQLGTAGSGCELDTPHCQVREPGCFNIEGLAKNEFKVPFDSIYGTSERTGYAIRQELNTIHITACFAEAESPIVQEIRLP